MRINEKIERSNKKITAHGGTLLLRKLVEELKLKQRLDTCIRDKRHRSYKPSDIILSTVLMLHTGGRYIEDIARMAEDETLPKHGHGHSAGNESHPASVFAPNILCRLSQ